MRARAIVRGYLIATEWRGGGCGNEAFATFADKEAADHGLLPAATRICGMDRRSWAKTDRFRHIGHPFV
jgi:hypothetical protein